MPVAQAVHLDDCVFARQVVRIGGDAFDQAEAFLEPRQHH
jgi:hypothetical protein